MYVFRALPLGADSRPGRFVELIPDHEPFIVCWGGATRKTPGVESVPLPRPKGRPVLMALSYGLYACFVFFIVLRSARAGDVCVFIDLESAILGVPAARLRRAKSVFDVADPFFLAKPVPCPSLMSRVEEAVANHADVVTLPHEVRSQVYPGKLRHSRVRIVENVPAFMRAEHSGAGLADARDGAKQAGSVLTLGYFGGLEAVHRGLEDLIALTKSRSHLNLVLAGRGDMTERIQSEARACDRIRLLGPYEHSELFTLCQEVDVYVGLYYTSRDLHRLATPNKFYEHCALGIPFLTSKCTPFAQEVEETETGWAIEDGLASLQRWADQLSPAEVARRGRKSSSLWTDRYERYYSGKSLELQRALDQA